MILQLEALAGQDIDSETDDDSWGDELEKELAGDEDAPETVRPHFF